MRRSVLSGVVFSTWAVLAGVVGTRTAVAQVEYTVADLGTLPGAGGSSATAINASGQVVGSSGSDAFLYSNGKMTDLGPGTAYGINGSKRVVGQTGAGQAFVYSDGVLTNLTPEGSGSADAINDSGVIVGTGFVYSNGVLTFPSVPYYGRAYFNAINNNGQSVGYIVNEWSLCYPFIYSNGTFTPLATDGWTGYGVANAINSSGQVVGSAGTNYSNDIEHAFVYSNHSTIDLGTLGNYNNSSAFGINDSGEAVGDCTTYGLSTPGIAFLYTSGQMWDLNSLIDPNAGWTLQTATGINDTGQIVGQGINPSGVEQAYLLTPVPEPGCVALFGLAAVAMLTRRVRNPHLLR